MGALSTSSAVGPLLWLLVIILLLAFLMLASSSFSGLRLTRLTMAVMDYSSWTTAAAVEVWLLPVRRGGRSASDDRQHDVLFLSTAC
jgi:hypothetical protein